MSFWSWGEPSAAQQNETQTASFWRWGEPAAAPTPAQPEPAARSPTFWWSEPEAPASTATYTLATTPARSRPARKSWASRSARHDASAPSRRDVDLAHARQQTDAPTEPEAPPDASPPKWSEPIARALWSAAHRISDPRQLGERLKRRLPAFRDALTHVPVRPGSRRIALTIDDAPSDLLGPVLDALKACGVKATFFVIADFCSTYARRRLLERAVSELEIREGHDAYIGTRRPRTGQPCATTCSCYGMSCEEVREGPAPVRRLARAARPDLAPQEVALVPAAARLPERGHARTSKSAWAIASRSRTSSR